ncbi:Os01g0116901 [Oryza sativa Japonica Group]|uniref:Os01g0116901 protein n=1 Tax=Oryza sativa subsp. japonica TaxID=39947 RepID=A0A0P0UXI5_ORYSJ|nr:Os01g0116901 [Oryza sativa Japonica Group]
MTDGKALLQGVAHHHRRMAWEELGDHRCHLQASLSPRSSSVDQMTSSECTVIQQRKAPSPAHACRQCQRSHMFLVESTACTPGMDSMPDLSLLHSDLHFFFLRPFLVAASQSYTHQICLIWYQSSERSSQELCNPLFLVQRSLGQSSYLLGTAWQGQNRQLLGQSYHQEGCCEA